MLAYFFGFSLSFILLRSSSVFDVRRSPSTRSSCSAFHLSKTHSLSDYCLLFAQDSAILQGQAPERGPINAFFSGLYQIVGFKHRINSRGAQSEFKLIKTFGKETQVFGDEV